MLRFWLSISSRSRRFLSPIEAGLFLAAVFNQFAILFFVIGDGVSILAVASFVVLGGLAVVLVFGISLGVIAFIVLRVLLTTTIIIRIILITLPRTRLVCTKIYRSARSESAILSRTAGRGEASQIGRLVSSTDYMEGLL
jgi:hypothetical protein